MPVPSWLDGSLSDVAARLAKQAVLSRRLQALQQKQAAPAWFEQLGKQLHGLWSAGSTKARNLIENPQPVFDWAQEHPEVAGAGLGAVGGGLLGGLSSFSREPEERNFLGSLLGGALGGAALVGAGGHGYRRWPELQSWREGKLQPGAEGTVKVPVPGGSVSGTTQSITKTLNNQRQKYDAGAAGPGTYAAALGTGLTMDQIIQSARRADANAPGFLARRVAAFRSPTIDDYRQGASLELARQGRTSAPTPVGAAARRMFEGMSTNPDALLTRGLAAARSGRLTQLGPEFLRVGETGKGARLQRMLDSARDAKLPMRYRVPTILAPALLTAWLDYLRREPATVQ